jgi:hypothetical protein
MAFLDNLNPPRATADLMALRARPTANLTAWDRAFITAHGCPAAMRFDPACASADDPENGIIKPNDRGEQDAGRWVFDRWH